MQKLFEFIDNSKDKMVELESLLTSHPALAPENGGQGEDKKAAALTEWLLKNGFSSQQIVRFDAPDRRVESGKRPSLVVTIPGESDEHSVWVMAHLDVVPVGDLGLWKTDPWKVVEKDGKLFGRGVEDNQQGLVSGVFAALAYIIWLLKNTDLFKKNDLYLIPDGGDPKGETIEVAEKNILWLKVHVKGKQCHGSRPDQGKNACLAACALSLELHNLQNVFNKKDSLFEPDYSTFQPTMRFSNVEGVIR